jgi:23S rRNA (adenine2030-N6)-methyltransferase
MAGRRASDPKRARIRMLSYQHAYHAGGPADLHKHAALAALLALLKKKRSRAISYLETHAGRAVYDITWRAPRR